MQVNRSIRSLCLTLGAAIIVACSGSGTSVGNFDAVTYPCVAAGGDTVVVFGTYPFAGPRTAFVNGVAATVIESSSTSTRITIPAGIAIGLRTVELFEGTNRRESGFLEIGATPGVTEVEPNDDIDGTNATNAGRQFRGSGNLASLTDRDHFRFDCFVQGKRYRMTRTGAGSVFVNGTSLTLDAVGTGVFTASATQILVGLTGGTGAYTIEINAVVE